MAGELGSIGVELYAESGRLDAEVSREKSQLESLAATMSRVATSMKTQLNGVSEAGAAVKRVNGVEESAKDMEHLSHTTVGARREMLVLAHEISMGNFKRAAGSVMVLGERMDWMTKIMSPTGAAIGAVIAIVGGLAFAFYEASKATEKFNSAIQMTGGYSAASKESFDEMANTVSNDANVSLKSAEEAQLELIKTGRFQITTLHDTTIATLNWMHVTGESADAAAKSFARMRDDAVKWAEENNKQYHVVTGAQLQQMADLEKLGDKQGAYEILLHALMQAQGADVEHAISLWRRFVDVLQAASMAEADMPPAFTPAVPPEQIEGDREKRHLQEIQDVADARTQAYKDEVFQATQRDLQFQKQFATRKMKRDAEVASKLIDDKVMGKSAADTAKDIELINESYKDRKGPSTTALDNAQLEAQLKPLQNLIAEEGKLYTFRQRTIDKAYHDNKLSAQAAYDTTKTILDAQLKVQTDAFDQEAAILERAKAHTKDAAARQRLQNQIQELQTRQTDAQTAHDEKLAEAQETLTRDTEAYTVALEKLAAALGKAQGKGGEFARAEYDRVHKGLLDQAKARGDTGSQALIAQGSQLADQEGTLNDALKRNKLIYDELAVTQAKYNQQVKAGQASEIGNWLKIDEARKKAAQELEPIVANMERIAQLSGQAAMIEQATRARESLEQLKESSDQLGKTLNDTFASSATHALESVANGTKTLSQAFIEMCDSIAMSLTQLIAKDLMDQLFNVGGGGAGPGSAGGLGGLISALINGAGGGGGGAAFDASTFALSTASAGADTEGMSALMGLMGGMASGGAVGAGSFYEVNERGPELLTVANRTFLMTGEQGGRVTPVSSGGVGGGGRQNTFNMNIAVPPGTTRQSAAQQASEIMRHAQIAMARNT